MKPLLEEEMVKVAGAEAGKPSAAIAEIKGKLHGFDLKDHGDECSGSGAHGS